MDSDEESNSCGEDYISGDDQDPMEKCCFANEIFEIPESFCEQEEVFNEVLSFTTWETVLSDKQKERLKMLLPTFPGDENDEEKDITLRKLFNRENFKFGNPLTQFFERLKDGFFSPEVVEANKALKKASYREYKNRQTRYHYRLFQQILLSRKKLLESAYMLPPDQPVKMQQFTAKPRDATLSERTRLRYFSILQDVREECCEPETSSEDENYPESSPPKVTRKHKKQLQILEASLSPEITRVTSTTAFPPGYPGSSHFLNRCLDMIEVSEERYREMLQTYKQKKLTDPTYPELDVSKVDLNDMIARANLSKRPLLKLDNHTKKKPKLLENADKIHKAIPAEGDKPVCDIKPSNIVNARLSHTEELSYVTNGEKCPEGNVQLIIENEFKNEAKPDKIELEAEPPCENMVSPAAPEYYQYPMCFFSLLRDLFCESAELKVSASKLEEKVRSWQEGPTASFHEWIHLHESWSDLVSSALRFLAGDLLSILPENFVPFLDYKEKQQQWQWIGSGRDSEELLVPLCQHWLENKDDVSLDVLESSQGSPPPPRTPTVWTVRATTDEEKILYREQERVRYQNPHKAFTFKVHGYESVVGPVKGVYGKESGVNKAREHSLLISDRPPFVTILSLVRDAAARLPNGEGTRADICELLKDSQYLSLASDQQIHTVVSGALDRLHYEKDPCVKYDVNRKLWIYLHRSRTEEEFERIHQAQAVAAKARKAVQKSKPPKPKNKDLPRTPPSATASSSSDPSGAFLNVDVTTISPNSSHSPRGSGSPRTQSSPKHSHPTANRHLIRTLSMPVSANVKTSVSVIHDNTNNSRKSELTQANLAAAASSSSSSSSSLPMGHSVVPMNSTACSPQGSIGTNVLPSFHSEGNNSRPPSQGSVQSLPSPKTVIANVNAAQFVSVGSLQVGPTNSEQPVSSSVAPCIGVLSVDMKPSSPSFVGQPPVLQPVLSHQTMVTTSPLTCVSTAMASSLASSSSGNVPKSKLISSHNACSSKSIPSFQTIVIKPDSTLRSGGNISSLPLLSMEELSATDSTVLNSNPVVARLLHGSQLLSLGNIMAGAASGNLLKQGQTGIQNFKIQGANFGQQVLPTTNVNLFQSGHSSVNPSSDVKLPRLSLVNHETGCHDSSLISSTSAINQSTVYSINQGMTHLPAETKVSSSHREMPDTKRLTISSHNLAGMRPTVADLGHLLDSAGAPNHVITSSSTPSCNISNATVGKSAASAVIGTQETLKPMASTYVMASPITNASMLTSQHGLRAATSLNMRALHSIKVIPVPQSMGPNKNIRSTPLLARIISPSSGMTLRSAVPSELVHAAHHLKGTTAMNIVHGLQSVANQSHILKAAASHTCTNSDVSNNQPFIIQVQAPKTSNEDLNL